MAEFDAELYLRLTGEQALLDPDAGDGGPLNSPLDSDAHALVAVGVIPAETAQAVVDECRLAFSYRGREGHDHHRWARLRARRACLRAHRWQAGTRPATATAGIASNQ